MFARVLILTNHYATVQPTVRYQPRSFRTSYIYRRRREDEERETRRQEREVRKLELEADLLKQREAIEAAKREYELKLTRLAQGSNVAERAELREDRAKAPKLPSFVDGKDDFDAYLQRFERFSTTAKWEKTG